MSDPTAEASAGPAAVRIAVIGGECTGKTVLCEALAERLPGLWVPEFLREFVDARGRAPRSTEQAAIVATQVERERDALELARQGGVRWIVFDSAPIATAIYSSMYFGDASLLEAATRHHARYDLTLLAEPDLPWEPDGPQRDGPDMRAMFQERALVWLRRQRLAYVRIAGAGESRIGVALDAVRAVQSRPR
jgi:nicotinamide riboside kinase